ncbi:MAG: desulfoferrodoxin family protein [Breznakia sp.]
MRFIKCEDCDIIALVLKDGKVCAGEDMEIIANSTDGAGEKHVPAIKRDGDLLHVQVGEVEHPMTKEHHIAWIYVETKTGGMLRHLNVDDKPTATFNVANEEVTAVYEYCNLHGLWKVEL